ncbi:MAG: hypothetical protein HEP71_29950 [Roseivirga sp.]|nr:hypothetical protein [Roseivirga sp.]
MLWLAETSPQLTINSTDLQAIEKNKVVRLSAEIQNIGYLPTNITQRSIEAKLYQPARAILELENAKLISGKLRTDLGHISGSRDSGESGTESKRTVNYAIKITGKNAIAKLTIRSDKGGIVEKLIKLN